MAQIEKSYQNRNSKKYLVTGGNKGIGKAIAEGLLQKGHKVVITSRDMDKGNDAAEELIKVTGNGQLELIQGDLSSIDSCFELAKHIRSAHQDLTCLINNAGVWMAEKKLNADGLEMSFMVNHMAPYILSHQLLDTLSIHQSARIVNVNAGLYIKGKLDIEKTPTGEDFSPLKTYANTKLCSILFAIHFSKQLQGTGVTINSVHPGIINTGLGDSPKLMSRIIKQIKRFWKSPSYGAKAPVWLATDESLNGVNGKYFNETKETKYIDYVLNEELQESLDQLTKEIIQKHRTS